MTGPQFGKPNAPVPGFGFTNLADKAENGFRNGGRINSEVGLGYISGSWLLFCKKKKLEIVLRNLFYVIFIFPAKIFSVSQDKLFLKCKVAHFLAKMCNK